MSKRIALIFVAFFAVQGCRTAKIDRETVLDNISHVEDSIHFNISRLPRLCDDLRLEKRYVDIGGCNLL